MAEQILVLDTATAAVKGKSGLDASVINSGTMAQARLGTGSAGAGAKFLADDQTYKTVATDPGVSPFLLMGA